MPDSLFEQNLNCLAAGSPEAARAVAAARGAPEGVEFAAARNGMLTARWTAPDGRTTQLHSAYDPEAEAKRFLSEQKIAPGKWMAWFGPGLWHGVRVLALLGSPRSPALVVEADPRMLRAVMERALMQDVFSKAGLQTLTGTPEEMRAALRAKPRRVAHPGNYITYRPAAAMNPDIYSDMTAFIQQLTAETPPHIDPENVVRREAFGPLDPAAFRLVTSMNDRYADSVAQVLTPHGAKVRPLYDFPDLDALLEFNPTCFLAFSGNLTDRLIKDMRILKEQNIPIILWNVDDPKFFRSEAGIEAIKDVVRMSTVYFTHTEEYLSSYGETANGVHYLPTGARPDMYGDPLPDGEQQLDFSLFGIPMQDRVDFFRELARRLPGMRSRFVGMGMAAEDYRDMIRHTRVNLTAFTTCDVQGRPNMALSDRVWETPYAGGFLLQDVRGHLKDHFAPDEIATFTDAADCAEKIRYFVARPEERARILRAARARIRREHLMAHRMETILKYFNKAISNP